MEDNHDSTQKIDAKKLASVPMIEENGVALPSGTHIGNFRIEKVLGIGGFGIVYLAIQDVVARKVAIKEFFPAVMVDRMQGQTVKLRTTSDLSLFDTGMKSFVNEAIILSSLSHPSLVQVLHFWQENGTAYMVMPYYEGEPLSEKMKDKTFEVSVDFIGKILDGLLPALEYLHQQNIYHRDISPENIFVLKNGSPMLLDFGAARQIVEEGMNVTAMLKPSYAPIEQYDKTAKQGAYTDIYALCATLYHLITKKQPQASVTRNLNNYMSILMDDPLLVAQYPLGLLKAIDAGLQILPDARPQTIAEWRKILQTQQFLETKPKEGDIQTGSPQNPSKESSPDIIVMSPVQKKNKKTGMLLVLLVLGICSATYAYLFWSKKQTNANIEDITMLDVAAYNQVMEQYAKINNIANDIDTKRLKNDLLALDKQIKAFTPPQVVFDLKKKKLLLEQEKNAANHIKDTFLKDNHLVWQDVNLKVQTIVALKEKNQLKDVSQLIEAVSPVINDLHTKLFQYQTVEMTKNRDIKQKLNGKWALTDCNKDASDWRINNNTIDVSVANKQLAAEEIIAVTNGVIFTVTQNVSSYPNNTNELFFEYRVSGDKLEIRHLSQKQKLKRCL